MDQYQYPQSDTDELFSKSSKVVEYSAIEKAGSESEKEKDTVVVKKKKTVPSNITCHCAGKDVLKRLIVCILYL